MTDEREVERGEIPVRGNSKPFKKNSELSVNSIDLRVVDRNTSCVATLRHSTSHASSLPAH
jgi:hypothetical protein